MKRHVFSQLSCFKRERERESSENIEQQQQQILLHEIHIKVSFFYLTPLSESSMVLHTILLCYIQYTQESLGAGDYCSSKPSSSRNGIIMHHHQYALLRLTAASKQASKAAVRPSEHTVHIGPKHTKRHVPPCYYMSRWLLLLMQSKTTTTVRHHTTTAISKLHITCDFSPYLSRD